MKLIVLNSDSSGNCYILESRTGERLIIEAGVKYSEIKKAVNYEIGSIAGCVISHYHLDHSGCINELLNDGVSVWANNEVFTVRRKGLKSTFANQLLPREIVHIGSFLVYAFPLFHDCDIYGFLIHHSEIGNLLFATDTAKIPYQFKAVNHYLIEANYCEDILAGYSNETEYVRARIPKTHLSVQRCIDFLKEQDLTACQSITLIHLSDRNSDAPRFKQMVESSTGKITEIADKGITIEL